MGLCCAMGQSGGFLLSPCIPHLPHALLGWWHCPDGINPYGISQPLSQQRPHTHSPSARPTALPMRQFRIWGALLFRPITPTGSARRARGHSGATRRPDPIALPIALPIAQHPRCSHWDIPTLRIPSGHPNPTDPIGASRPHSAGMLQRSRSRAWQPLQRGEERREPEDPSAHIYLNLQELQREVAARSAAPQPHSPPHSPPHSAHWETHRDTESGHLFYYNPSTGETTWDCPFQRGEDAVSPGASPPAWGHRDDSTALPYGSVTGEGLWDPHCVGDGPRDEESGMMPYSPMERRPPTPEADYPELSPDELEVYPEEDCSPPGSYQWGAAPYAPPRRHQELTVSPRWYGPPGDHEQFGTETVLAGGLHQRASSSSSQDSGLFPWPGGTPVSPGLREEKLKSLDKAGVLNRTKTMDRGKRIRKNWSSSWTVLEGGILTFFKDSKHSSAGALRHPTTLTTPEHTVELRGAAIAWASKEKSSKKNVLELRTREGSEFLIQHDSEQIVSTWQRAIADSIAQMGSDVPTEEDAESGTEFGSREKLGAPNAADGDSSKVRNKLRKFLQRRPTLQSLRERGYIKDQVFGCSLQALCEREHGTVPHFVQQCIHSVERRGLDIDGLYRVSGNLATIQKLRYKVDHEEHLDLDDGRWEDVHVITGALKLFFRELPEPLVPFGHFDKFIAAIKMQDPLRKGRCIRDLVRSLPPANHDTMKVLFRHLCRVIEFKEENRMSVQSIAIVFGPTLLRAPSEEGSMAVHMVFQNQVVELILNQYGHIFPDG